MARKKTQRRSETLQNAPLTVPTYPMVGDTLDGRFEILEKLGEGVQCVIYKALDTKPIGSSISMYSTSTISMGEGIASKLAIVHKTLKVFGLYAEAFHNLPEIRAEAAIYKNIQSPSVPHFFKLHETEYLYYEFEYVEAVDLYKKLKSFLNKKVKIDYAVQLADTMQYLHYRRVEHNDLKPENILIDKNNRLFVIDFALSTQRAAFSNARKSSVEQDAPTEQTSKPAAKYTPEYCPPETQKGEEKPYQRDIFAYGVILYEMFYGKHPFRKRDAEGNIDYTMPKHLTRSGKKIDKIIKKCLHFFDEDRYQGFTDIVDDLEKSLKQDNPIFRTITKYIFRKVQFSDMTEDFKRDLKFLYFWLLCMLVLLPVFIYVRDNALPLERYVEIDAPPFEVLVNAQSVGRAPLNTYLMKDDVITFVGDDGLTYFEMSYNGEKKLRVDNRIGLLDENKRGIFVNHKRKGLILFRDQYIPKGVKFVSIRADIPNSRLKSLTGKGMHIAMTSDAPSNILNFIPHTTEHISLRHNNNRVDLRALTRFRDLKSLDLAGASELNIPQIPALENLRVLNLQGTRTEFLRPINDMPRLKDINLSDNELRNIEQLSLNRELETINLNNNPNITSFDALTRLPNLKNIEYNNDLALPQNQRVYINHIKDKSNFERVNRYRIISQQRSRLELIVNTLAIALMSIILIQLMRLSMKRHFKVLGSRQKNEPKPAKSKQPRAIEPLSNVEVGDFKELNQAVQEKRIYLPDNNNALYYLSTLLKQYPKDNDLQKQKKEVLKTLKDKIKHHLRRKEYEPIYLATKTLNKYFPSGKYKRLYKKSINELQKNISPIKFVSVKGGIFQMGDFEGTNYPLHEVRLHNFKITETTITNSQFCEFLNSQGNRTEGGVNWIKIDTPYSHIGYEGGQYYVKEPYGAFPVYEVSWYGAQRFCEWLGGRLPTEAEWEFAARSRGQNMPFAIKKNLKDKSQFNKEMANYLVDENDTLWHSVFPVKSFPPNAIGLYEMSGNILEWCFDWYDKNYYTQSQGTNPRGPSYGELKAVRGGGWCFTAEQAMTYYRGSARPISRNNFIGFRAVLPE